MREKAKEILEGHFGSDFWKIEKRSYFENIINAMIEFKGSSLDAWNEGYNRGCEDTLKAYEQ